MGSIKSLYSAKSLYSVPNILVEKKEYTPRHVAEKVESIFEGQLIYQTPYPVFYKENKSRLDTELTKHFYADERPEAPKVARVIHAKAVKNAIKAKKEVPQEVLEYHQFTPGLLNDIKRYNRANGIGLEY